MEKKKLIKNGIALATLVSLCFFSVSCNKETSYTTNNTSLHLQKPQMIYYYVDGACHKFIVWNDVDLDAFFERMIALANEGHNILFSKTDNFQSSLSKEKVVYSTNDFDDAKKWMLKMLEDGYQVSFSFDEETGEYTCIAIK